MVKETEPDLGDREVSSSVALLTIPKITAKYNSNGGKGCPLMFNCSPKGPVGRILDADCFGNTGKFSGCHIFIEKGLTAPPRELDVYDNVSNQCETLKNIYKILQETCINKKTELNQTQKIYKQTQKGLLEFKRKYFM